MIPLLRGYAEVQMKYAGIITVHIRVNNSLLFSSPRLILSSYDKVEGWTSDTFLSHRNAVLIRTHLTTGWMADGKTNIN